MQDYTDCIFKNEDGKNMMLVFSYYPLMEKVFDSTPLNLWEYYLTSNGIVETHTWETLGFGDQYYGKRKITKEEFEIIKESVLADDNNYIEEKIEMEDAEKALREEK